MNVENSQDGLLTILVSPHHHQGAKQIQTFPDTFPQRCQAVKKNIFPKINKNMEILLFSISVRYEISVNKLRQMFYKITVKSNLIPKSIFPISSYRFMEPYQCIESYRILIRQNTRVKDSLRKIFILRSLFELLAEVLDV